jgi:hypothetical protein
MENLRMGKEEKLKTCLIQSVIEYVRAHHKEDIDKAYTYFWDENQPDEFMGGTALELGFLNFEDWLVFDYKVNPEKETFIDIYARNTGSLNEEEVNLLWKIKSSFLSMYEVSSMSRDKKMVLKDLLLGGEVPLRDKALMRGLKQGDIFATRLLDLDGRHVMSCCVYPYSASEKETVLTDINKLFARYIKNENPDGTMVSFLKDYGDAFNLLWMNYILDPLSRKS